MKVCLVLPLNRRRISPQPYYLENLGIQYVASYLQQSGFQCTVLDADGAQMVEEDTVSAIERSQSTVVGFSVSIDTVESVLEMCKMLRSRDPNVLICLGGQHATYFAADILTHEPSVDFVVLGEGEETMAEVCHSLLRESRLPRLEAGLAYRDNGRVVCGSPVLLDAALDEYPDPERSILESLTNAGAYAMPLILTSRGCPNRCTFCSSHDYFGGKWRTRSPQRVVDEMERISETYGFSHFYFADDQILGRGAADKAHLLEVVEEILRRKLHLRYDLYSFVMMRADFHEVLTAQELSDLRLAGFKDIFVGFESGSDRELALFAKGFRSGDYAGTLHLGQRFFLEGGFILFHPYASAETLAADAQLIRSLGVPVWSYYSKRLVPYPGTKLFEKMTAEGKLTESNYKCIRYELAAGLVQDVYEASQAIERALNGHDDQVFAIVDAYQKARLSERTDEVAFAAETARLTAAMQSLVHFYYKSFISLLQDPGSAALPRRISDEALRQIEVLQEEYRVLSKRGVISVGT